MHKTMKTDTGVRLALANPAPTRRVKPALLDLNNNTLDDRLKDGLRQGSFGANPGEKNAPEENRSEDSGAHILGWTLLAGFRLRPGGYWVFRLYDVERQAAYTKGSVFLYTLGTWCVLPCCLLALRRAVAVRIVSSARSDLAGLC